MAEYEIPEGKPVRIDISSVGSDLRVRGWDRRVVSTKDDNFELVAHDEVMVGASSSSDGNLRVPYDTTLVVDHVGADAKITDISGSITLGTVGSDLILRKVGPVTVSNVGADLRIKRAEGDVSIDHIGRDATIREVEGLTHIGKVGADLYVRDVIGGTADNVGADLVLSTDFAPGATYAFNVGADIVCRIPPEASVRFRVPSDSDLSIDASGVDIVEGDGYDEIVIGGGQALVEMEAGGEIRLVAQDEDYMMAINFQLEGELEERLTGLEEQLAEKLSGLDEKIMEKAERVRARAEKQTERAMRHAERAMRKSRKHGVRFTVGDRSLEFAMPRSTTRPTPAEPPPEPVSDDERLMILKMVEAGQITVEEAETLLAALEGR